jgi:hypothetical protein
MAAVRRIMLYRDRWLIRAFSHYGWREDGTAHPPDGERAVDLT